MKYHVFKKFENISEGQNKTINQFCILVKLLFSFFSSKYPEMKYIAGGKGKEKNYREPN